MGHRPYPNADRALRQVERGRLPDRQRAWIDEAFANLKITPWQRAFLNRTLTWPKHTGKSALTAAIADQAVKAGQHVHIATRRGVRCHGARGACGLRPLRPDVPPVIVRAVRTCLAVPSQWNAWTVDGQYLYMRYRCGVGTVDAYDTEDSEHWTRVPDGDIAIFDTGDTYGGDMSLAEFCERAGLRLADDAEVTGE